MDEYLFITLAKLKADRLKLEREQRRVEPDPEQLRLQWAEPVETTTSTRRSSVPQPVRNSGSGPLVFTAAFTEGTVMRTALTLTAAVVISLATLAALEWSANREPLPAGEVSITQIEEPTPVAPLAQAEVDRQVARTAGSL